LSGTPTPALANGNSQNNNTQNQANQFCFRHDLAPFQKFSNNASTVPTFSSWHSTIPIPTSQGERFPKRGNDFSENRRKTRANT
jgi:hypothetical protein